MQEIFIELSSNARLRVWYRERQSWKDAFSALIKLVIWQNGLVSVSRNWICQEVTWVEKEQVNS